MNFFTWPKEKNDWILPVDQYNEEFKNWRGPIHNGQFLSHTLNDKIKTEETCYKYAGSAKFNGIPREVKPEININYYKDQCCEHIITNGMWDVFSPPYPRNKDKKWDLLLHQSIFPLESMKLHLHSLRKGSEADQYVVQNLMWSGVYMRITLSNNVFQKVLSLVTLTATGTGVFVATMNTFLSDYYDDFE